MFVLSIPYVSVRCDKCGYIFDEFYADPKSYMTYLKKAGWIGSYKKCYCPKCSEEVNRSKKKDI